ncbi:T9SS type A sorting domain-containing protein [Sporocytophaga myxococcoides]|uniref:T9SS type A sorting domain-containing protein n=1 Tax=Sporocytophaga myxococcoides TaxID=153721 RepID=UPI0004215621|nr:T9SS type A sorting domain-containing protein [Sporocytophaga myxococcoides]
MKKFFTLVLILTVYNSGSLLACSWFTQSFCETINNKSFVAKGKIVSYQEKSIRVKLLQTLIGEESADTIIVWDEKDETCMDEVYSMSARNMGEIGDTIFFTVEKIAEKKNDWDQINDYRYLGHYISTTFLHVQNDTVNGFISGVDLAPVEYKVLRLALNIFLERFQDCKEKGAIVITSNINAEEAKALSLFPNPAENLLNIDFSPSQKVYQSIVIKNQWGHQVKTIDISASSNIIQIDMSDIAPGVVFVELVGDGFTDRRKIVKVQ